MTILSFPQDTRADVADLAERKLKASPYYFLKRVTCEFAHGALLLRGQVPIPALRSVAESIVADIDGVAEVINCVEICEPFNGPQAARSVG